MISVLTYAWARFVGRKFLLVLAIGCASCIALAGGKSSDATMVPVSIDGIEGYGTVTTGSTDDGHLQMQIVKCSSDSTVAKYIVIDSFSTYTKARRCGQNTISYVMRTDSCFHIVTIGPLPVTQKDTVVSFCFPGSVGWGMLDHFLLQQDSLFACVLMVDSSDPVWCRQCLVGRIVGDDLFDTVALIHGVTACRPSLDGEELFLGVVHNPDSNKAMRSTVGVFDVAGDSLFLPLDTTYDTWAGYRLSRDKPLYYIKSHPVHGHNVWRWDPDWGEELVTFFPKPDVVRGFELTADSLICFVGMEGDSASTGLTRVAFPIDAE